jgi:hypothetical protein
MNLGVLSPQRRKSVWYCLIYGHAIATFPALLIIGAGFFVFIFPMAEASAGSRDISTLLVLMGAPLVPFTIGSLWWSFALPHWRIWALRTVDKWPELERLAVMTGLVWPRGWIFEKTEFKSAEQRVLETALLRERDHDR